LNEASRAELHAYIEPIAQLLRDFVNEVVPPASFQEKFFPHFAGLPGVPRDEVGLAAEQYFQSVEDWDADERLRDAGALTTPELRRSTHEFLALAKYETSTSAL
jgi:hypothetical protein